MSCLDPSWLLVLEGSSLVSHLSQKRGFSPLSMSAYACVARHRIRQTYLVAGPEIGVGVEVGPGPLLPGEVRLDPMLEGLDDAGPPPNKLDLAFICSIRGS